MATKTNQPQQEKNRDFGLPQEEFKPIASEGGKWFKITAIIVILVLSMGMGIVYWFFYHAPSADLLIKRPPIHEEHERETPEANVDFVEDNVPAIHQPTKKDAKTSKLSEKMEALKDAKETRDFNASHAANRQKGTVTRINVPRGYYYVVVGSFIDGDLASDYANRLAKKGVNAMLITPPQGKYFFRVAIEKKDTFYDANKKLAALKAEYGTDIWVIKY